MARRPRKPSRWLIALAESLLLPCLLASGNYAAAADIATSPDIAEAALALEPAGASDATSTSRRSKTKGEMRTNT